MIFCLSINFFSEAFHTFYTKRNLKGDLLPIQDRFAEHIRRIFRKSFAIFGFKNFSIIKKIFNLLDKIIIFEINFSCFVIDLKTRISNNFKKSSQFFEVCTKTDAYRNSVFCLFVESFILIHKTRKTRKFKISEHWRDMVIFRLQIFERFFRCQNEITLNIFLVLTIFLILVSIFLNFFVGLL